MEPTRPIRRAAVATLACMTLTVGARAQPAEGFISAQPRPRVEYWQERVAQIEDELRNRKDLAAVKLVFIGDSITDFWLMDANLWVKGPHSGRKVWDQAFTGDPPENLAINLGVSGDRIEHVLHRLLPRAAGGLGHLDAPALDPDFIVLMLGINNTWAAEEPVVDNILAGLRATLDAVHARKPRARILLQSILPTSDPAKNRDVVVPANARLRALAQSGPYRDFTVFLDLYPSFVDAQGVQVAEYFYDGLHPATTGYEVWRRRLEEGLKAARVAAPAR